MVEIKFIVIVCWVRKVGYVVYYGGLWKVVYVDFVIVMMVFFLVLWLMVIINKNDCVVIFEYFCNFSLFSGQNVMLVFGMVGLGGVSILMIKLGGVIDILCGSSNDFFQNQKEVVLQLVDQQQCDKQQLEVLMKELQEVISRSQVLELFKDQLLLDLILEGLCIQIVDKQNWLMFDFGSVMLKLYMQQILYELVEYLNYVLNWISLIGYIDIIVYLVVCGYGNWELSVDCVNVVCCVLVDGGLEDSKIICVVGLFLLVLFDKVDLQNLINCCISIVVMIWVVEVVVLVGVGLQVGLLVFIVDFDVQVVQGLVK